GLIFMAYNAHLAEQFEVVQRWVAGGNASGGYSAQGDPLLGVVDPGAGPRLYPFEHDKRAYEIDLGPDPFVTLQWGAYFFVPSIPLRGGAFFSGPPPRALRPLPGPGGRPLPRRPAVQLPASMPRVDAFDAWRGWLEDRAPPRSRRDAAWAWVRQQPGGVVWTR